MDKRAALTRRYATRPRLLAVLILLLSLPPLTVAAQATPVGTPGATPRAGGTAPWWRSGLGIT